MCRSRLTLDKDPIRGVEAVRAEPIADALPRRQLKDRQRRAETWVPLRRITVAAAGEPACSRKEAPMRHRPEAGDTPCTSPVPDAISVASAGSTSFTWMTRS